MTTALHTVVAQLDLDTQCRLVAQVREVLADAPLVRPTTPSGQPMRVRISAAGALGWLGGDAKGYRYSAAQRDGKPWPHMPAEWREIADTAAGPHPWDSVIVNWYDADASLGWHCDVDEVDTSLPIVTISLGDSCSWAVKPHADDRPTRCRLPSGSVTLLAGPTRLYWHTVERVIAEPLLSPLTTRGRISLTIRVAGGAS